MPSSPRPHPSFPTPLSPPSSQTASPTPSTPPSNPEPSKANPTPQSSPATSPPCGSATHPPRSGPISPWPPKIEALRSLLEGVIRRQARCLLIDPYANAFMADLNAPPLKWSVNDKTDMKQGVGERKYELDSLCYPYPPGPRLLESRPAKPAPFDARMAESHANLVVATMRVQQRKTWPRPLPLPARTSPCLDRDASSTAASATPSTPSASSPAASAHPTTPASSPFLIPSNLFAVTSLRHLAEMAHAILNDPALDSEATSLADGSRIKPSGNTLLSQTRNQAPSGPTKSTASAASNLMDDANVPSLLGLPYLASSPDPGSLRPHPRPSSGARKNPWFFHGSCRRRHRWPPHRPRP